MKKCTVRPRVVWAVALALLAFVGPRAGAAEPVPIAAPGTLPTVDQVLEKYVEAAGGRAALEKMKSQVVTGTIQMESLGVTGKFRAAAKAPNRQLSSVELEGFGSIREGYDGQVAWSAMPLQGVKQKPPAELERVKRTAWFPRELNLKSAYGQMTLKGAVKLGTAEAWVIEAGAPGARPDRLYFDRKSGHLIREEVVVDVPLLPDVSFEMEIGDYRSVNGIKVPHSMKLLKPADMAFEIRVGEVKHNVDLPDGEFAMPKP